MSDLKQWEVKRMVLESGTEKHAGLYEEYN